MQTFLPYANYYRSASILDKKRCWKQVIEAYQILNALDKPGAAWYNHPATRMWRGYRSALEFYYNTFYHECINHHKIKTVKMRPIEPTKAYVKPPWSDYEPLYESHRSNLLRKNPEFYGQYNWKEPIDLPYLWPVDINGELLNEIVRFNRKENQ